MSYTIVQVCNNSYHSITNMQSMVFFQLAWAQHLQCSVWHSKSPPTLSSRTNTFLDGCSTPAPITPTHGHAKAPGAMGGNVHGTCASQCNIAACGRYFRLHTSTSNAADASGNLFTLANSASLLYGTVPKDNSVVLLTSNTRT
jgi:hypothetical protein